MYKLIVEYADSRYGTLASFVASSVEWANKEAMRYARLGYNVRVVSHPTR